jgi:hypothetical protein
MGVSGPWGAILGVGLMRWPVGATMRPVRLLVPALLALVQAPGEAPDYAAAMADAKKHLRARAYDEAAAAAKKALGASEEPKVGGPERHAAEMLRARIAEVQDKDVEAARRYRDAAHAALDDRRGRARALSRRRRALFAAKRKNEANRVTELLKHDQRLRLFERYPRRSEAKRKAALKDLAVAERVYRADRDGARVELARAVKALVLARSGEPDAAIEAAKEATSAKSWRARAVAQQALYYAYADKDDHEAALDAAIRFNGLEASSHDEARRLYVRTRELQRACRKLEAENEAGTCARRQLAVAKRVFLTDYSRHSQRRGPLSSDELDRTHHEALPWLESCVLNVARQDMDRFAGTDLTISWVVGAKGRPDEVAVRPSRYAEELKTCLEDVVGSFRYPRVRSKELSSVSIPYSLNFN